MTPSSPVQFRLIPEDPRGHRYAVSCTVSDPDPQGQRFSLPAWIPGSYMIRDFAKHIVRLRATSGGNALKVRKVDKSTWQCEPCREPLLLHYDVYAWDLSVRGAHLDTTHAYFNGTSVFVRVHGHERHRQQVDLAPPAGETYRHWRVATALPRLDALPYGFGLYGAADYEALIDHPVEMGEFTLATFEVCGVAHDIAVTGRHYTDMERLCQDLTVLCEHQVRFFGGSPPFDRYVFLVTAVGEGYGGLEHRDSCSLLCSRDDLPHKYQSGMTEKYRGFLNLASHEYFHVWNVKRIRPLALTPYDLTQENYTRGLWFYEGCTSYYQGLFLVRSGLITPEAYLELLGQLCTRLWRTTGRFKQSLADASFDAWIKFYKQDENAPNAIVNYYIKGALVALALDLWIRRETRSALSLDDVMRALWRRYGETGRGVPEEGVERMVAEVTGAALPDFFDEAVRGTADPPLPALLADFGIEWFWRQAGSVTAPGGEKAREGTVHPSMPVTLGAKLADHDPEARLMYVDEGGAAYQAGLAANDVLVAWDGLKVTRNNLDSLLRHHAVGDKVSLHVFRRDELLQADVTLEAAPVDTVELKRAEGGTDGEAQMRCRAWLGGTEDLQKKGITPII